MQKLKNCKQTILMLTMYLSQWTKQKTNGNGMEKHALSGDHYMANDQMEGVFAQAIDLDWIQDIILDKTG
jgi:hypothetical protein